MVSSRANPDLVRLIEHHGLSPHLFADDTQVDTAAARLTE